MPRRQPPDNENPNPCHNCKLKPHDPRTGRKYCMRNRYFCLNNPKSNDPAKPVGVPLFDSLDALKAAEEKRTLEKQREHRTKHKAAQHNAQPNVPSLPVTQGVQPNGSFTAPSAYGAPSMTSYSNFQPNQTPGYGGPGYRATTLDQTATSSIPIFPTYTDEMTSEPTSTTFNPQRRPYQQIDYTQRPSQQVSMYERTASQEYPLYPDSPPRSAFYEAMMEAHDRQRTINPSDLDRSVAAKEHGMKRGASISASERQSSGQSFDGDFMFGSTVEPPKKTSAKSRKHKPAQKDGRKLSPPRRTLPSPSPPALDDFDPFDDQPSATAQATTEQMRKMQSGARKKTPRKKRR